MVTPHEIEQARQDLDQRTFRQEFEEHLKITPGAIYSITFFHPVESSC